MFSFYIQSAPKPENIIARYTVQHYKNLLQRLNVASSIWTVLENCMYGMQQKQPLQNDSKTTTTIQQKSGKSTCFTFLYTTVIRLRRQHFISSLSFIEKYK